MVQVGFNAISAKEIWNLQIFLATTLHRSDVMVQKGVYPYEYIDGWEKLEETSLPPKTHFTAGLI